MSEQNTAGIPTYFIIKPGKKNSDKHKAHELKDALFVRKLAK